MVAIVDPHIKKTEDFRVYADALRLDVIVKKSDGESNYDGWCWTGSSVWVDFFSQKARNWWKDMFNFAVWKVSFFWGDR